MSTLRPGRVSQAIADLRNAALKEMDATPEGVSVVGSPKFDKPTDSVVADYSDDDNWVARYPGQNSPHIGNGSGGPK